VELRDAIDFARTSRWSILTYRAAMVTERRAVVRLTPGRAYGMLSLPRRGEAEEVP